MNFETYIDERQQRINTFLTKILPNTDSSPQKLHQAMHYAVLNGGKRVRPLLVYATGELFEVDLKLLDYPATAIELIHAYSLVHDDLPAMDNDDLRRGKPTCHKAFGEATAILVGDALQSLAFSILSDQACLTSDIRIAMVSCLAKASGSLGMAGGQALDIIATGKKIGDMELETIHNLKTGTLIRACIELGYLSGNCQDKSLKDALLKFAKLIGLCFQIKDDILDSEGNTHRLGKRVGTDAAKSKATFTTLSGLAKAKENLHSYYEEALELLTPLGDRVSKLKSLAEYIVIRDH